MRCSPYCFQIGKNRILETNLTLDQIKNSPDIDTDKPVSRQQEAKLYEHFSWHSYWFLSLTESDKADFPNHAESNKEEGNPHLRSSSVMTGYEIQASDGPVGHLTDFIIETDSCIISDLVVDTGRWLSSKNILLPVNNVLRINWYSNDINLALNMQETKQAHPYDPESAVNRLYDGTYLDYFGRLIP